MNKNVWNAIEKFQAVTISLQQKLKIKKNTKNTIKTNGNQIQIRCQMFQKIIEFKVDAYTC